MNRRGFTLFEMLVSVSVMAFAGVFIAGWLARPAQVQTLMLASDSIKLANSAMNQFVNDLGNADPTTIQWNNMPPLNNASYTSIQFGQPQLNYDNPSTIPPDTVVQYQYVGPSHGVGSLVKTVNGGAPQTILRNNVLAPTATTPLVSVDTGSVAGSAIYNVLIVQVTVKPLAGPSSVLMRRVAVTQ